MNGDAISGKAAINYAPGTSPPWTIAIGPQYDFKVFEHDAFVRVDWEYTARNPWLAPVQDPSNNAQYDYGYSYTLPATSFTSVARRHEVRRLAISAFCDNLFDTHTGGQLCAGAGRLVQSGRAADAAAEQLHLPPAHHRITATFKM